MYPKFTARLIVRSIEVVRFWGALPLRWNKRLGSLDIIQTKTRYFLWFLNALAQLLNFSFLIFRYVQLYYLPSVPAVLKTYLEYVLLCYCYGIMYHTILYLRLEAVVDFINGYKQFFTGLPKALRRKLKVRRGCDILLAQVMIFGHFALSLNLLILFRRPERLVYFTSLFSNPRELGPLKIMPFAAVHIYIWWSMWALLHFLDIHSMACAFAQVEVLKYLNDEARATGEDSTEGRRLASLYRTLQTLQGKFDNGLGLLLAAHKICVTFLIIRGVYSGLMDTGGVRYLCCFTGLMAWGHLHVSLKTFGEVHEVSKEVLMTMKLKNNDPWSRRFHRSCTPLKVHVSKLYFCDRGLPMTLTAFIFDSTVGLLVAQSI